MGNCVFHKGIKMNENADKTNSRKDQILRSAFELMQNGEKWSLSEISAKLGISKTAIYRHFSNKAEIEAEMDELFVSGLTEAVEQGGSTPNSLRTRAIDFFKGNNGFLHLFFGKFFSSPEYELALFETLLKRSPLLAEWNARTAIMDADRRAIEEIRLIKNIISVMIISVNEPKMEVLQKDLLALLENGLKAEDFPGIAANAQNMPDDKRLDELDGLCVLQPSDLGEANRFFEAIAASIRENGIHGTTIQKIAERMGTAKSSLYFYYNNKQEMLKELVLSETEAMKALCDRYSAHGRNFLEQLYILMMVQSQYLLLRPDILPVFNWIRYEIIRTPIDHPKPETEKALEGFLWQDFFGKDKRGEARAMATLKWASILSTSIVIQHNRKGSRSDSVSIRQMNRLMFHSMLAGDKIESEKESI